MYASYQYGLGLNSGIYNISGLSLLLVLSLAPRGFSPLSSKYNTSKLQFDLERMNMFKGVPKNS